MGWISTELTRILFSSQFCSLLRVLWKNLMSQEDLRSSKVVLYLYPKKDSDTPLGFRCSQDAAGQQISSHPENSKESSCGF